MPYKKVPFGDTKIFNAIIEVPAGGRKKYAYDPEIGAMKLERILYGEIVFPFNYGHVAKTMAPDNSPLDVFVFTTYPIHTGMVVECRPVGMLEVVDRGKRDNKVLAVPINEPKFDYIQDIGDVPSEYLQQLRDFFIHLPEAWNTDIKLVDILGKNAAVKELLRTLEFGI